MMPSRHKNFSAFTLIELLAVISIIGLLAAVAFVALGNARKTARDAKRIADLKQMRTMIEKYMVDTGKVPGDDQVCYRSDVGAEWNSLKTILENNLPADPTNTSNYRYAYFRSQYAPGGCAILPQCGWLMTRREKDNYLIIMSFSRGAYSINDIASSWTTGIWNPNCGGSAYSGYVQY